MVASSVCSPMLEKEIIIQQRKHSSSLVHLKMSKLLLLNVKMQLPGIVVENSYVGTNVGIVVLPFCSSHSSKTHEIPTDPYTLFIIDTIIIKNTYMSDSSP